jgi:hypothetical protein
VAAVEATGARLAVAAKVALVGATRRKACLPGRVFENSLLAIRLNQRLNASSAVESARTVMIRGAARMFDSPVSRSASGSASFDCKLTVSAALTTFALGGLLRAPFGRSLFASHQSFRAATNLL